MRALLQRVSRARVSVDGASAAEIGRGLLILVGVGKDDTPGDAELLSRKIRNLRIFEDENGKMNLNIEQVKGSALSVPQFTLYADTSKGNRPGFGLSAEPNKAKEYWARLNTLLRDEGIDVGEGVFGAHMDVELVNDGPVTIWLDESSPS